MSQLIVRLLLLLSVTACCISARCESFCRARDRPHILLIMADDIGIEGLSCYGGESYATPHLDRLARDGMRFTHAYAQPLCTPTRVQLMTGRYNHRNWQSFGILDPKSKTFGHLLQTAGYRTAVAGKWQLYSYDPPDFPGAQDRRGTGMKISEAGFDEWSLFHAHHTEDKGSRYADPTADINGTINGPAVGEYGPDRSVDFVLDFFQRSEGHPTFVYYAMSLPHWPMVPTPNSDAWRDPSKRLEPDSKYFPDMVSYMDQVVGRLREGLEQAGLADETLILFYSDNGTDIRITSQFRGRTVRGGKAGPTQTGIRVPLIAAWPGRIAAGATTDALVDASDFVPTLAEAAGISVPDVMAAEGISFLPVLRSSGFPGGSRETCFFWYDPRPGWDKERFSRHIFALNHRYKVFRDGRIFDIAGTGLRELPLLQDKLTKDQEAARRELLNHIETQMQPPISPQASVERDAFGNPVKP